MSRSYKRHPVVKDNAGGSKFAKRRNNKMVRKVPIDEELPTRARKFFTKPFVDQYDIHDFSVASFMKKLRIGSLPAQMAKETKKKTNISNKEN